ncbi:MAG: radical SAM family heme chaperone HemW [Nitrospirota bacterium]
MESVYIHVPFCVRKCIYCDFLSVPFDPGLARAYVEALACEVRLREGGEIKTLYLGGGTPTVLPDALLKTLFGALMERFTLLPGAEVTMEANPGTLGGGRAGTLRSLGVNRLSIGVQSFRDEDLRLLGRVHSARDAEEAAQRARKAGFENVSLDLVFGIPGQTPEGWQETLERALSLSPAHISAYELTPEAGTPLMEALERGDLVMPGEDVVLEMFARTVDTLAAHGLFRYEISNYARPGRECRHNLNYWDRGEYLGLGAGAHSLLWERRESNTRDIGGYIASLSEGALPVAESNALSREDILREVFFLGLRKTEGIEREKCGRELGVDLGDALRELEDEGLLEVGQRRVRLTGRGMLLFNPTVGRLLDALNL